MKKISLKGLLVITVLILTITIGFFTANNITASAIDVM